MLFSNSSKFEIGTEMFSRAFLTCGLVALTIMLAQAVPAYGQNLIWAQRMGGDQIGPSYSDGGFSVALDSERNVYVVGYFTGTADFGPYILTSTHTPGSPWTDDIFVAKLDRDGEIVWARSMGGPGGDVAYAVAVDDDDNVYVSGEFKLSSAQFGDYTLTATGSREGFVCKLDSEGVVQWAKSMGGPERDAAWGLAVDANGNTYVTGDFESTATFGKETLTSRGGWDIFVTSLDTDGNFRWANRMGSAEGDDRGFDVAVDSQGTVYTTGFFTNTADFGSYDLSAAGGSSSDMFVARFDSQGNFLTPWRIARPPYPYDPDPNVPGSENFRDCGYGLAVDSSDNIYVTGFIELGPGALDPVLVGLDNRGTTRWYRRIIGPEPSWGSDVTVDDNGNIYVTGQFGGWIDFDYTLSTPEDTLHSRGDKDAFVARYNSNGNIIYAGQMGGPGQDVGYGVTVDADGTVYATGFFSEIADVDPGPGIFDLVSTVAADIFVIAVDDGGPITTNVEVYPNPINFNDSAELTATVDDSDTGGSTIASAGYEIRDTAGNLVNSGEMSSADGQFDEVAEDVRTVIEGGTFQEPGVYQACVRGTDVHNSVGDFECIYLPIFDPYGSSVTGGGWIHSPPGAYVADPNVSGKANFGFVAEYKKGANIPTGVTEFNFKAGDLNFHSHTYEWLVVAGPRAMFRGTGTINGEEGYTFLLVAIDGAINGGKTDKFRIMIWGNNGLVYDNKRGEDPLAGDATELGGGNITIHK